MFAKRRTANMAAPGGNDVVRETCQEARCSDGQESSSSWPAPKTRLLTDPCRSSGKNRRASAARYAAVCQRSRAAALWKYRRAGAPHVARARLETLMWEPACQAARGDQDASPWKPSATQGGMQQTILTTRGNGSPSHLTSTTSSVITNE